LVEWPGEGARLDTVLVPPDGGAGDQYGWPVALGARAGVVGAPGAVRDGEARGAAYVVQKDEEGGWRLTNDILPACEEPPVTPCSGRLGHAVAVGRHPIGVSLVASRLPSGVYAYELSSDVECLTGLVSGVR